MRGTTLEELPDFRRIASLVFTPARLRVNGAKYADA